MENLKKRIRRRKLCYRDFLIRCIIVFEFCNPGISANKLCLLIVRVINESNGFPRLEPLMKVTNLYENNLDQLDGPSPSSAYNSSSNTIISGNGSVWKYSKSFEFLKSLPLIENHQQLIKFLSENECKIVKAYQSLFFVGNVLLYTYTINSKNIVVLYYNYKISPFFCRSIK